MLARRLLSSVNIQSIFFQYNTLSLYGEFKFHIEAAVSVVAVDSNPCQTNPCLHGGSCLQEGDGYSCYCPQGFSGESCEIGESLAGQRLAGGEKNLRGQQLQTVGSL